MKTLAVIFALQINFLFGSNDGVPKNSNSLLNSNTFASLAPITPLEATFEEVSVSSEFSFLAPSTPVEAGFEEEADVVTSLHLGPVTPVEADFSDDVPDSSSEISSLAPVTPTAADFEDLN